MDTITRTSVKVTMSNGDSFSTEINLSFEEAKTYYLGKWFNMGIEGDLMAKAILVEEII